MGLTQKKISYLLASCAALLLAAMPFSVPAAADQGPSLEAVDAPIPYVASRSPGPAATQTAVSVRRHSAIGAAALAAAKAAAVSGGAPEGAVAIPVPGAAVRAAVVSNFQGLNRVTSQSNGFIFRPPDTILGKSPNRIIEATNSVIRLSNNVGGVIATATLNTFFGAGVIAGSSDGLLFDPKVYFDRNAVNPRVYVVGLQARGRGDGILANNVGRLFLAISRSIDPTNLTTNWCRYNIDSRSEIGTVNESWGDFPGLGTGRDSLSITLNNFTFNNDSFRFARIHVIRKDPASNNAAACPSITRFIFQPSAAAGNGALFTIQPAQHYSSPSSGAGTTNPAYFLSTNSAFGSTNQYHVHRVRNVAGAPTYTRVTLASGAYSQPADGNQPGGGALIDSGDTRMLQVAGIGNTLMGQMTSGCNFGALPNESCVRTPRVSVGVSGTGALVASIPENVFQGFGANLFVHHSSIATDFALRSGATWEFNGAARFLSSAAMFKPFNGAYVGVQTYAGGTCNYPLQRAGDYSGAQLDPDGTDFWLAGERALVLNGSCQWDTRVVKMIP